MLWIALLLLILQLKIMKPLKNIIKIFLSGKLGIIFLTMFLYDTLIIFFLHKIYFFEFKMIKDFFFWIMFTQIIIFNETITKAKSHVFFKRLFLENVGLSTILSFIFNFWSFNLWIEFIMIPLTIIGMLAFMKQKNEIMISLKNKIKIIFYFIVLGYLIYNLFFHFNEIFNFYVLKIYLFPIIMLGFNLPLFYGLALLSYYEQTFALLKGTNEEKIKMKKTVIFFAKDDLFKISKLRNNPLKVINKSFSDEELKLNLKEFSKYLETRIGDNYMERIDKHKYQCFVLLIVSIMGILWSLDFEFINLKGIIKYISIYGVLLSITLLIYILGLRKKKCEDISQVKKFALQRFLIKFELQMKLIEDITLDIEDVNEIYYKYFEPVRELKLELDKVILSYENLFSSWELEEIQKLQSAASLFLADFHIPFPEIYSWDFKKFEKHFIKKIKESPKTEDFNIFLFDINKSIEMYNEQLEIVKNEFKNLLL